MLYIRMVEEAIADNYGKAGQPQEMRCPVHLSIGQEASAVGVVEALESTDVVYSTHRCHAHYLAKNGSLDAMIAEIYGKSDGCVGGRGGSMHLQDIDKGVIASIPIVASVIPLGVGAALKFKMYNENRVAAVFFGDAAMEEGVWHESANFAQMNDLPVVFVCENNMYSVYTPLNQRQPNADLTRLAKAHCVKCFTADGNNVEETLKVSQEAVKYARSRQGPVFLMLTTYRYREHCGPNYDDHLGYRPEGEREAQEKLDPVITYKQTLIERGELTEEEDRKITSRLASIIDESFASAKASPLPNASTAFDHVYA